MKEHAHERQVARGMGTQIRFTLQRMRRWNGDKFDKEILFWDNQAFMQQIGLAQ